jgi:hypothetical protein
VRFLWHYHDFCYVRRPCATVCGASAWRWTILLVPTRWGDVPYFKWNNDATETVLRWPHHLKESLASSLSGLDSPDFFLWGYLRERETVYKNSPRTLVDLKCNIEDAIKKITAETLLRVSRNMCQRVNLRLQENAGRFQHLLWKSRSQVY